MKAGFPDHVFSIYSPPLGLYHPRDGDHILLIGLSFEGFRIQNSSRPSPQIRIISLAKLTDVIIFWKEFKVGISYSTELLLG